MHKTTFCGILIGLIFMLSRVYADFELTSWQYYKLIQSALLSKASYMQVTVDQEIYNCSLPNLDDLRIINKNNEEVPYQVFIDQKTTSIDRFQPQLYNKSYVLGMRTVFCLDMGTSKIMHNALCINTPNTNFRRRVKVEGSNDERNWYTLTTKAHIFDFTDEHTKVHYTTIHYPENHYRYLRVTLYDEGKTPLKITSAELLRKVTKLSKEERWGKILVDRRENKLERTTEIVLDFGARNIPCHWVDLDIPEANYYRHVTVESSRDGKEWYIVGDADIYSIKSAGFREKGTGMEFSEVQNKYLKIAIHNYDDQPLPVNGVKAYGWRRRLVFCYEPGQRYRLFYGNPKALSPQYDLPKLLRYFSTENLSTISLGTERRNTAYIPPRKPWTESKPYLLWLVMAICIIVLGLLLTKMVKDVMRKHTNVR